MSSIIDPITGLPYDALDTTLYSIPLNSQPALAPEWNPQGRITSTVYPDNLPTVFATMQAQNEQNPSTVQAATMDGEGNLNVNVKVGGGGGGSVLWAPDTSDIDYVTASSFSSQLTAILNNAHVATLYRVQITIAWDADIINAGEAPSSRVFLRSSPNGATTPIGIVWGIARPGVAMHNLCDTGTIEIIYPGGWVNPWFIDPSDTQLTAVCQQNDFVSGLGIVAEWKAR